MYRPWVSIIIPTRNEESDIRRTLDACVNIDYPYKEIIVVDDSTDRTPQIVEEYRSSGVRLIKRERNIDGRCGARNVGIRESKGEILVILNADVMPPKDFITRLLVHYENGADYVLVESKVANDQYAFARFVDAQHRWTYGGASWIGWTEGFSCRREAAFDVGLFPVTPVPLVSGEDGYFGRKLAAKGYKKVIDRSIVVDHVAPWKIRDYWRARKEKVSPVADYFLYERSLASILPRAFGASCRTVLSILTIVPIVYRCWRLTRFSRRGPMDFVPFLVADVIQSAAFVAGRWEGLFRVARYRFNVVVGRRFVTRGAGRNGSASSQ
jgi:glycosyltransferase involved in cell wall biosynthesis